MKKLNCVLKQFFLFIGLVCLSNHNAEAATPSVDYNLLGSAWNIDTIPLLIDSTFVDTFSVDGETCALVAAGLWSSVHYNDIRFDTSPSGSPEKYVKIEAAYPGFGNIAQTYIIEDEYVGTYPDLVLTYLIIDIRVAPHLASSIHTDILSDAPDGDWHMLNIILHELGHALGFAHAPDTGNFKVMLAGGNWTNSQKRSRSILTGGMLEGDIAALEFVYKYCYGDFDKDHNITEWGDYDNYFEPAYGSTPSDSTWLPAADFDSSNEIDFPDFLYLAAVMYQSCSPLIAYKPIVTQIQLNQDIEFKWNWELVEGTDLISVAFDINNVEHLQGYSLKLAYEATKLKLVARYSNVPSKFRNSPAIVKDSPKTGIISIADVFPDGQPVTENKKLLLLTFRNNGDFSPDDISIINASISSSSDWRDVQEIESVSLAPSRRGLSKLMLHQNFPNPFNPETAIAYELPNNGHVLLVIYNTLGQAIRTLVQEDIAAGFHRVIWDGKDDRGINVSSGIYLYKITFENHRAIQKMVLLK